MPATGLIFMGRCRLSAFGCGHLARCVGQMEPDIGNPYPPHQVLCGQVSDPYRLAQSGAHIPTVS